MPPIAMAALLTSTSRRSVFETAVSMTLRDVGFLRNVAMDVVRQMARCPQLGGEGFALRIGDVGDEDMRAFPRHGLGDRVADAVGSAGDDDRLSVQTSHVILHSARRRFASSKATAAMMIMPVMTSCHSVGRPSPRRPLDRNCRISTPSAMPVRLPMPPARLTPPSTVAATT